LADWEKDLLAGADSAKAEENKSEGAGA